MGLLLLAEYVGEVTPASTERVLFTDKSDEYVGFILRRSLSIASVLTLVVSLPLQADTSSLCSLLVSIVSLQVVLEVCGSVSVIVGEGDGSSGDGGSTGGGGKVSVGLSVVCRLLSG